MPIVECPACKSRELYEIDHACFESPESINGVVPLALFAHYGPSGEMGWMGAKSKRTAIDVGARICGSCGHASLFTRDLERLKRFAATGLIKKL